VLDDHGVFRVDRLGRRRAGHALAESLVDTFKTELIADRVWSTRSGLELAIVEYVAWFNTSRLHSALGEVRPAEFETALSATTGQDSPLRGSCQSIKINTNNSTTH
jgi:putative transposase